MAIDPIYQNEDGTWKIGHPKIEGTGVKLGSHRISFKQIINNIKTDNNKQELVENLWKMALSKDENIALRAIKILMETVDGKATQQLEIIGSLSIEEQMKAIKEIVEKKLTKDNE